MTLTISKPKRKDHIASKYIALQSMQVSTVVLYKELVFDCIIIFAFKLLKLYHKEVKKIDPGLKKYSKNTYFTNERQIYTYFNLACT